MCPSDLFGVQYSPGSFVSLGHPSVDRNSSSTCDMYLNFTVLRAHDAHNQGSWLDTKPYAVWPLALAAYYALNKAERLWERLKGRNGSTVLALNLNVVSHLGTINTHAELQIEFRSKLGCLELTNEPRQYCTVLRTCWQHTNPQPEARITCRILNYESLHPTREASCPQMFVSQMPWVPKSTEQ